MTDGTTPLLYAPISLDELVDKVNILEIKRRQIRDPAKQAHVHAEHALLNELMVAQGIDPDTGAYLNLRSVNQNLWELENRIRAKERRQSFDTEFLEIARRIHQLNDRRHALKHAVDVEYDSSLVGEKEYNGS